MSQLIETLIKAAANFFHVSPSAVVYGTLRASVMALEAFAKYLDEIEEKRKALEQEHVRLRAEQERLRRELEASERLAQKQMYEAAINGKLASKNSLLDLKRKVSMHCSQLATLIANTKKYAAEARQKQCDASIIKKFDSAVMRLETQIQQPQQQLYSLEIEIQSIDADILRLQNNIPTSNIAQHKVKTVDCGGMILACDEKTCVQQPKPNPIWNGQEWVTWDGYKFAAAACQPQWEWQHWVFYNGRRKLIWDGNQWIPQQVPGANEAVLFLDIQWNGTRWIGWNGYQWLEVPGIPHPTVPTPAFVQI